MQTSTLFKVAMWGRIIYGTGRILLAFSLLGFIGSNFSDILTTLMQQELIEDPNDLLYRLANNLISGHDLQLTYFAPIYLIFWGFIDTFLSIALLKNKHWAFPVSISLITLFTVYEIYRVLHTHSVMLAGLIIVDIFELWLINRERKRLSQN